MKIPYEVRFTVKGFYDTNIDEEKLRFITDKELDVLEQNIAEYVVENGTRDDFLNDYDVQLF